MDLSGHLLGGRRPALNHTWGLGGSTYLTPRSSGETRARPPTLLETQCRFKNISFPLCNTCQLAKSPNKQKLALPSSSVQMFSVGFSVTMVVWNFSDWMSSLNSVLPHSQSTKISTSELRRRDFRDSIWIMLTCFSCESINNISKSAPGNNKRDATDCPCLACKQVPKKEEKTNISLFGWLKHGNVFQPLSLLIRIVTVCRFSCLFFNKEGHYGT